MTDISLFTKEEKVELHALTRAMFRLMDCRKARAQVEVAYGILCEPPSLSAFLEPEFQYLAEQNQPADNRKTR